MHRLFTLCSFPAFTLKLASPRHMKPKDQLRQLPGIILALMLSFLCSTEAAYARGGGGGGCFASDTPILTPAGYKPISQLK